MPLPRALSPFQASQTLAHRLRRPADRLRQFCTRFGLRPYRCFLVWTTFDGEERGEGTEHEVARVEILPTPKVVDLTALQRAAYPVGVITTGTIRVDRISVGFSEAQLKGLEIPGQGQEFVMPKRVDFWWELREDGRDGESPVAMRFRLSSQPYRAAGKVSWSVVLERQDESTQQDGLPPFAAR